MVMDLLYNYEWFAYFLGLAIAVVYIYQIEKAKQNE